MNPFKKLASDTVIYGMSSIVGRFLNWWLMPLYVSLFAPDIYGIVTNLYSYVAFFMVFLTYGMETGFFRFASKNADSEKVYSTSLVSLVFTSLVFIILVLFLKSNLANAINYPNHSEYILWLAIILGIDAITAIPFARLRLNNRPIKFAFIKLVNIGFNIAFNLFFLLLCPKLAENNPDSFITIFYSKEIGVGYVFISNLLASFITLLMLFPDIVKISFRFELRLLRKILSYSFPILIVGLAGIINQHIDKILIPFLIPEDQNPMQQLGIYGAGVKIAVLMNMFIQAFRYAFEPFFFSQSEGKNDKKIHADIMKYFIIFGLLIFLGMVLYIDVIKLIIPNTEYHEGFSIVPVILLANLFFGIYFALSMWYKLTDMTRYGAYIAIFGAIITISLNVILIPVFGYKGSAFTVLICFFTMALISYFLGQKYYPIPYNVKRIAFYFLITAVIFIVSTITSAQPAITKYLSHTFLILIFLISIIMLEKRELKPLFKINKKK
ncbi:MAG: oligosaccharide flippase family protein [Prolixibacteraceae bacterium]|nr:oligosaccharide flippase family protein [Prolixibacteraceae bacterium]MBT6005985.1 oligosaccharide flippase family protein [Prolixibacteraceae bacterium]MBT6766232.1 oligosaccharide flippase family protein [Prolixibacteraceae bacterium]MBT7000562.1 oligosaccharide flippase family protein [Prolixibacteraceae bacterium]MBT7393510.1 oligosaccharide flippase family protein [Prolixibacteraceae bacterium]